MSKKQQHICFTKIGSDKLIYHRIAVTESIATNQPTNYLSIQPTPNPNNNTTKYEQINLNYRPSDLGIVCPKRTSGRASFENKIRSFTNNIYIYKNIYKIKKI